MSDLSPYVVLSLLAGGLAGFAGCAIALAGLRHLLPRILADIQLRVGVDPNDLTIPIHIMAPQGVRIPVTIAAPDAVTIPVELTATASAAASSTNPELAARILAEVPDIGPRALSRILGVSSSTAQGYINRTAPPPAPAAITDPRQDSLRPDFQGAGWWTKSPTITTSGGDDDSIQ